MPKVAFFEVQEQEAQHYRQALPEYELVFYSFALSEAHANLLEEIDALCIFVHSRLNRELIQRAKRLKLVVTRSTGYDHIDLSACRERNIKVAYAPDYATLSVAEHTLALIFALAKRLIPSYERTSAGIFDYRGLETVELHGKTLGVIGTGRIGRQVALMARSLGMKVLAYDLVKDHSLGIEYVELPQLLKDSDIISLHANLWEGSYHMLGEEAFELMKDGVLIVNTARGGLIDTRALLWYLLNGKVGGVAVDVLEYEDIIRHIRERREQVLTKATASLLLMTLQKGQSVVVTPHNGFNSLEAKERLFQTTVENIRNFFESKPISEVP